MDGHQYTTRTMRCNDVPFTQYQIEVFGYKLADKAWIVENTPVLITIIVVATVCAFLGFYMSSSPQMAETNERITEYVNTMFQGNNPTYHQGFDNYPPSAIDIDDDDDLFGIKQD